MSNMRS
nr:unnamed protein product [Callosobruchus chinensis]